MIRLLILGIFLVSVPSVMALDKPLLVVSRVDVACVQSYADNSGFSGVLPDTAIRYAKACREKINTELCVWVKQSPDGKCVLKLQEVDKYSTVLPETLERYREVCVATTYRCPQAD